LIEIFGARFIHEVIEEQLGYRAEIDMERFEEIWENYLENEKYDYLDIYLSWFVTHSFTEAQEFRDELVKGVDFHELLASERFAQPVDEEDETDEECDHIECNHDDDEIAERKTLWNFHALYQFQEIEDVKAVADLQVGEFSFILHMGGGFAIVYMEDIEEPDFDEMRQEWFEGFEKQSQAEFVDELLFEFMNSLDFNINRRAFESFRIGRIR
jgi:hypothetical protein